MSITEINKDYLKAYLADYSLREYGINVFKNNRKKEYVFERYNAMYVLKEHTPLRLFDIGIVCSNGKPYDHATVIHACNTVVKERVLYKDREQSISKWSTALFHYLGRKANEHSGYLDLIKRIKANLKMNDMEWEIFEQIEGIIIDKLFKK